MHFHLYKTEKKGFTIIELLVVIFIMGMSGSLFVANFRQHNENSKLILSSYKLVTDVRNLQSDALGLKSYPPIGTYPSGGWGAYFNNNSIDADYLPNGFRMYADYSDGAGGSPDIRYQSDENFIAKNFGQNVTIDSMEFNGVATDILMLVFEPPDPMVYICDAAACDGTSSSIILTNKEGRHSRVDVNKVGLVDVEEKICISDGWNGVCPGNCWGQPVDPDCNCLGGNGGCGIMCKSVPKGGTDGDCSPGCGNGNCSAPETHLNCSFDCP